MHKLLLSPQGKTREMYAEAWLYYLTGNFTLKQISEVCNIPYVTLTSYSGTNKWAQRKMEIHRKAGHALKDKLAERIEQARIAHQNFMLDQLDETKEGIAELKIGKEHPHARPNAAGQVRIVLVNEKLELLGQQQAIASDVLKLDDEEKPDSNRDGFSFLIGLASSTLPRETKAPLGILSSGNAMPEGEGEGIIGDFQPLVAGDNGPERIDLNPELPPEKQAKVRKVLPPSIQLQ